MGFHGGHEELDMTGRLTTHERLSLDGLHLSQGSEVEVQILWSYLLHKMVIRGVMNEVY